MIPVKTAVVGFGLSGKVFHSTFLHASRKFTISRIVQRSSRSAGEIYPYAKRSSFEEVLGDRDIELVVVAVPNSVHYEMGLEALEAGKHVIMEKPCAPTAEQVTALIDCAQKNDRQMFVFHNRRLDGDFLTVRKVVESGMLGRIVDYEAHYDRYKTALNVKVWKETAEPSITILHDLGTHIIDQAVALFGMPAEVTGKLAKQRRDSEIYDSFTVILGYKDFQATLKASLLVREEGPRYIINGSQGSFVKYGIDPQEDDLQAGVSPLDPDWGAEDEENWGILHTETKGVEFRGVVRTSPGNYMIFYDNVYDVLRNNAQMLLPVNEALLTPKIIDAVIESNKQQRTVLINS